MLSCRCDISVSFCHRAPFAPLPPRCGRAGAAKRLRVLERDASGIVEEELRKRVDALERDFKSDARASFAPGESLDRISEGVAVEPPHPGGVDVKTSSTKDAGEKSFLEDFQVPFDYCEAMVYTAAILTALGLYQSMQGGVSLDGFSLENLAHFQLPIQAALFAAVFLQAVAGWGFALAAITGVSILGPGVTVTEAQALVALVAIPLDAFMFYPYMKAKKFDRQVVDKWVVGAMIATPFGVSALNYVDQKLALAGLGSTILAYCAYATFNIVQGHCAKSNQVETTEADALGGLNDGELTVTGVHHAHHLTVNELAESDKLTVLRMADPKEVTLHGVADHRVLAGHAVSDSSSDVRNGFDHTDGLYSSALEGAATDGGATVASCDPPKKFPVFGTWASGMVAGMTGGAFDVPSPPLVMFADLTGMAADAELMRANLFAFFALDAQMVALSDLAEGRFDLPFLWPTMVLAIPTMLIANATGNWCGQFVDKEKFRWLVISLLAVCGLHQVGAF